MRGNNTTKSTDDSVVLTSLDGGNSDTVETKGMSDVDVVRTKNFELVKNEKIEKEKSGVGDILRKKSSDFANPSIGNPTHDYEDT